MLQVPCTPQQGQLQGAALWRGAVRSGAHPGSTASRCAEPVLTVTCAALRMWMWLVVVRLVLVRMGWRHPGSSASRRAQISHHINMRSAQDLGVFGCVRWVIVRLVIVRMGWRHPGSSARRQAEPRHVVQCTICAAAAAAAAAAGVRTPPCAAAAGRLVTPAHSHA
jgi:hypothetical protein